MPRFEKRSRSYGIMNGFVEEQLSGQKTIQAYAYEDQIDDAGLMAYLLSPLQSSYDFDDLSRDYLN